MKKQELMHTHRLLAEIANEMAESEQDLELPSRDSDSIKVREPVYDVFNLDHYKELGVMPEGVFHSKSEHRNALQELADSLANEIEHRTETAETEKQSIAKDKEPETSPVPKGSGETEARDFREVLEWSFEIGEDVVESPEEIYDKMKGIDEPTADIVESLLEERVRVIDRKGNTLEGWIEKVGPSLRKYGVLTEEMEKIDVELPDEIEIPAEQTRLVTVDPSELEVMPYAVRKHGLEDHRQYIEDVRRRGSLLSLPFIRPLEEGFQVFDGHKGRFVAEQAGVEAQLCVVESLSDWEATHNFVEDHIPPKEKYSEGESSEWYNDNEIRQVIYHLQQEWGEKIRDIDRIGYHIERISEDSGRHDKPESTPQEPFETPELEYERLFDAINVEQCVDSVIEDAIENLESSDQEPDIPEASRERLKQRYRQGLEEELERVGEEIEHEIRAMIATYGIDMEEGYSPEDETYEILPEELRLLVKPENYLESAQA